MLRPLKRPWEDSSEYVSRAHKLPRLDPTPLSGGIIARLLSPFGPFLTGWSAAETLKPPLNAFKMSEKHKVARRSASWFVTTPSLSEVHTPDPSHPPVQQGAQRRIASLSSQPSLSDPQNTSPLLSTLPAGKRRESAPFASTSRTPYTKKTPMFEREHTERVRARDEARRQEMLREQREWETLRTHHGYQGDLLTYRGYANYRRAVDKVKASLDPVSTGQKSEALREIQSQQRVKDDNMRRAFKYANEARAAPRPPKPSLPSFDRLTLEDRNLDKELKRRQQKRRVFPKELTYERERRIKELLRTPENKIASTMPGGEVTGKDLRKLGPSTWLNDEVINFYAVMLNNRSKAYQAELSKLPENKRPPVSKRRYLRIHAFTSFFYTKLRSAGYSGVRRWTKKIDIFACDAVIMPINLGNTHWVAACINLWQKRFEYYDSLNGPNGVVFDTLRSWFADEHLDKKGSALDLSDWLDLEVKEIPQQENAWDCGVFVSQVLECLARPDAALDYLQINMPYLRRKMIYEIGEQQFLEDERWE